MKKTILLLLLIIFISCNQQQETTIVSQKVTTETPSKTPTLFKSKVINGLKIAYREAGNPKNPTLILLHGFPSSSHQYRKVLTELSDQYHMIAPDYPGFGESDFPSKEDFNYTFDNIASVIDQFVQSFHLDKYSLMIQDYGAPIGFRIATAHPEKITSIINQNGNAYEAGLGKSWGEIDQLWANNSKENRDALMHVFSKEGLQWQYSHGTRNPEKVNPDTWNLDYLRLSRKGAHEINLDLFYDYQNNVKLYPKWQAYMRKHQPPMLIVWGKNDLFFPEPGAEAYKKDLKNIDYNIYDTGHFALEEDGEAIIAKMRDYLNTITQQ
ncbi:alpha/beta hydrolase [uncultured Kordia sp.]|uniref:alpha/beta fold hydrolase n=1 Tax=uncultured Kordia sp. TaxID=507699 RepID=UPI002613141E|nr:alpha/beta hydrolase [uncultured Kordia sp.]